MPRLKAHDGEIAAITMKWVKERVVYALSLNADWADDYFELAQLQEDDTDDDDEYD